MGMKSAAVADASFTPIDLPSATGCHCPAALLTFYR
jgi:hypothetical protein